MTTSKRVVRKRKASTESREERMMPIGLIANFALGLIKDAAFKDALNRALDTAENYVNGVLLEVHQNKRRLDALEHSIALMVKAREKLGYKVKCDAGSGCEFCT